MLPVLRSRFSSDIDRLMEDLWNPQISSSYTSSYSSFRDTGDAYELELSVPTGVSIEDVTATLQGGVLSITFPKVKTEIDIEVKEETS